MLGAWRPRLKQAQALGASVDTRVPAVANRTQLARVAVVVHPTRSIAAPLEEIERWAGDHGLAAVQVPAPGSEDRHLLPVGQLESGDLVVALGGDGTVLSSLRAAAATGSPVLGVACGSLGALTAVPSDQVGPALDRIHAGDWIERHLPALAVHPAGEPDDWAINDFVVVRRDAGQVTVDVSVDEELYVRLAGDGLVIATALGSSAYSMAAGGPVLAVGTSSAVFTPLAMHGGSAPPLVVPEKSKIQLEVHPGFAGFDVEIDGHRHPLDALDYELSVHDSRVTLVSFGKLELGPASLRARGLITDSPRVLARDRRAQRGGAERDSHP